MGDHPRCGVLNLEKFNSRFATVGHRSTADRALVFTGFVRSRTNICLRYGSPFTTGAGKITGSDTAVFFLLKY